jgi:general secretion pathway protein L
LLPARDLNRQTTDWQLGPLAFVLFSDAGQPMRVGRAALSLLPSARRHILILTPRDVLLLRAKLPDLRGPRLRLALPNLIEEQLVADPARSHVALGPQSEVAPALAIGASSERTLAVVDRAWLRFVLDQFLSDERRSVKVVPALALLSPLAPDEVAVTILGRPDAQATLSGDLEGTFELALQEPQSVCGISALSGSLEASAREFAGGRAVVVREVEDASAELKLPSGMHRLDWASRVENLDLASFVRPALSSAWDLCQFEFSMQSWQRGRNNLKRWRVPIGLAAAIVVVCLVALNIDWLVLSRQRAALETRAGDMLREAFPKTTVVLDAPLQMRRQLEALRTQAGEPDGTDFLVLCDRLARTLGPLGPDAIASLDYADRTLTVGFAPTVTVDAGWSERLAAMGLKAEPNGQKWIIRSLS